MKKVLFATTALVATAGIASAEVSLSGSAEIGLVGGDNIETQFHNDIDVKFDLSGETDNGLTFGATIDLDEVGDDCGTTVFGAAEVCTSGDSIAASGAKDEEHSVFISGGFGTVTMGDTDGALDWAMQEVNLVGGSIADDETAHDGFNGNGGLDAAYDGQVLRYDYSFGSFGVAASLETDDSGAGDPIFGLGVKYDADLGGIGIGFGLGYQAAEDVDVIGVSVDADFGNGFVAGINYSELNSDVAGADDSHMGIGFGYESGAYGVGINYGEYDSGADGFGIAATYDLGGAVVQFGYGSDTDDTYSLGVAMSF
ncbi:porin [Actibacterium lipolyticum]|uniref:Porin n=1 Tax=Actibacterium lipolyticum TaxID=1524263 RepID=A0A238KU29_9RHOB|nr:porin [Actibacterium lipolyticum]SMX46343.1 Porin [Actibacterium lipolyticum]